MYSLIAYMCAAGSIVSYTYTSVYATMKLILNAIRPM